jgi:NRAMP (natural resistance-associated macrophage protein)-like metal ion transporter
MSEASIGLKRPVESHEPSELGAELLPRLGPGLITGAADDDPSGIATYSQVGAQFGMAMLWTMLFSFPLMTATQEICGRLGRITGVGVAENLRRHYPKTVGYCLVFLLCAANIFNLAADISAMGSATSLVLGGSMQLYAVLLGGISVALQVFVPYRKYVQYLKWLTLVLFAYVATAFVVHVPWGLALRKVIMPSLSGKSDYWMALVAVLGTTISPYLFFWQTSQEVEEVRLNKEEQPLKRKPSQAFQQFRRIAFDTRIGMAFSNTIAFFIILTTAVTLHGADNGKGIQTAADAARALQPLAGPWAFGLFAVGIIGTGLLAVPVLAGSMAYAIAETFRWRASLEKTPQQAPRFYLVLVVATLVGIAFNFIGIDPIRALYWSAVINGVVSGPLMVILVLMSSNRLVVGKFTLPVYLRIAGWGATAVMLVASFGFLTTQILALR